MIGIKVGVQMFLTLGSSQAETPWNKPLPQTPDIPALYGLPTSGLEFLYVAGPHEQATIPIAGDDSGNNRAILSTSFSDDPAWAADAVNGSKPGAVFTSGNRLAHATAAPWAFMHKDAGCTILMRVQAVGATLASALMTRNASAVAAGCAVFIDGSANKLWFQVWNDSAICLNISTANSTMPEGFPYTIAIRHAASRTPAGDIRLNGTGAVASGNYSAARSSADPQGPLRLSLSYGASGINNWVGNLQALAIYSGILDDAAVAAAEALLPDLVSLRTTLTFRPLGDSITAVTDSYRAQFWENVARSTFWRAKMVGSFTNAKFPLADQDHDGVSGNTIAQIQARIAGGPACTDVPLLAGTNNLADVPAGLTAMGGLLDAIKAEHPTSRIWVMTIPYGLGGNALYTLAGAAGAYNAGLPAVCAAKRVHLVDIHAGATPWVPASHAVDDIGHPTSAGGIAIANTLTTAMGV